MYGIILSSKLIIPNWTDLVNGDEVEEDLAEEELPERRRGRRTRGSARTGCTGIAASCCGAWGSCRTHDAVSRFVEFECRSDRVGDGDAPRCLGASRRRAVDGDAVPVHAVDATRRAASS